MKKTIMCMLSTVLIFNSLCVFSAYNPKSLRFDAEPSKRSVEISEEVCGSAGEYVTVSVASQSKCETAFSKDNTPDIFDAYLLNSEGKIGENIKFPGNLGVGRYNIFINENLKFYTIYRDPSAPETITLIAEINSAADSNTIKTKVFEGSNREILGIDREDTVLNSYLDGYCDISSQVRTANSDGQFTADSFYNGFFDYIVCDMLAAGKAPQTAEQYPTLLGTTYEAYTQLNGDVKNLLTENLKAVRFISYKNGNPVLVDLPYEYSKALEKAQNTYDDALLLTAIKNCSDWSALQSAVMTQSAKSRIGISEADMNVYDTIKESLRYKVFTAVYGNRASFSSLNDVLGAFQNACALVKLESDSITVEQSTSSPSGGGSLPTISAPHGYVPDSKDNLIPDNKGVFSDIQGHYSEEYVNRMVQIGAINGYADGTFLPDGNVTRAEFSKMIMNLFNIEANGQSSFFEDVTANDWYSECVNNLSTAGILNGYDGKFRPSASITRQDAAVICHRVLDHFGISVNGNSGFDDTADISDYAIGAVASLASAGIIKGSDNKFMPHSNIKRGDSAIMLCRLFDLYSAN